MQRARTFFVFVPALLACFYTYRVSSGAAAVLAQLAERPAWAEAGIKGKLDFYVSKIDGRKRPYAVCATSESRAPKPLECCEDAIREVMK